jgi:hypothetical protein
MHVLGAAYEIMRCNPQPPAFAGMAPIVLHWSVIHAMVFFGFYCVMGSFV